MNEGNAVLECSAKYEWKEGNGGGGAYDVWACVRMFMS